MDLQLYLRVLWRFRFVVAVGFLVALLLSALSLVSIGRSGVAYRQPEVWSSNATLLVTQRGFPEGRSITDLFEYDVDEETGKEIARPVFSSSSRFTELAALYAALATSDPVRQVIAERGPLPGSLVADTMTSSDDGSLPLIQMTGTATSPDAAAETANRGATGFVESLERKQQQSDRPPSDRVVVTVVEEAEGAALVAPRKLTRPIFIFLAVMIAALGLAFVLENLRPRVRPVAAEPEKPAFRRSA